MNISGDYNRWADWYDEFNCPLEPLKPCPCCGGEAWLKDNGYEEPEIDRNGAYVGMDINEPDYIWVECQSCGLTSLGAGTPEEAIARWNKRQPYTIDPVKHGRWRSIKDDFPERDGRYLVYEPGVGVYDAFTTLQNGKYFWWENSLKPRNVTHWMQLPEPPTGAMDTDE